MHSTRQHLSPPALSTCVEVDDLRTIFGVVLPTFYEAIETRGQIQGDNTMGERLADATEWMMVYAL